MGQASFRRGWEKLVRHEEQVMKCKRAFRKSALMDHRIYFDEIRANFMPRLVGIVSDLLNLQRFKILARISYLSSRKVSIQCIRRRNDIGNNRALPTPTLSPCAPQEG